MPWASLAQGIRPVLVRRSCRGHWLPKHPSVVWCWPSAKMEMQYGALHFSEIRVHAMCTWCMWRCWQGVSADQLTTSTKLGSWPQYTPKAYLLEWCFDNVMEIHRELQLCKIFIIEKGRNAIQSPVWMTNQRNTGHKPMNDMLYLSHTSYWQKAVQ